MNLKIERLASNYRHPMGFTMGGYWALLEGDRIIVVDREFSNIQQLKREVEQKFKGG